MYPMFISSAPKNLTLVGLVDSYPLWIYPTELWIYLSELWLYLSELWIWLWLWIAKWSSQAVKMSFLFLLLPSQGRSDASDVMYIDTWSARDYQVKLLTCHHFNSDFWTSEASTLLGSLVCVYFWLCWSCLFGWDRSWIRLQNVIGAISLTKSA